MVYKVKEIMGVVDHSGLKAYATEQQIINLVDEAAQWGTYSVCIEPIFAKRARKHIDDNNYNVKVNVTLDFPFGTLTTDARVMLIKQYADLVDEVDLVAQPGYVRSSMYDKIEKDVNSLVRTAHDEGLVIKFITEDAYTTREQKEKLYKIICESEADFIKTSTGFAESAFAQSVGNQKTGADLQNVQLMADIADAVHSKIGIKVAGGVHSYEEAVAFLETSRRPLEPKHFRLGVSGTKAIREEMLKKHLE